MTFTELERQLPNGFHDSKLRNLAVDYREQTVQLEMLILVGLPDDPKEHRDDYRVARIEFSGLVFLMMDPPDESSSFDSPGELFVVDAHELGKVSGQNEKIPPVPSGAFGFEFFVSDWNSSIYLSARDCKFEWLGDAYSYRGPRQHFLPGESINL